ncbi:MAG: NADH-quinone oxidoreductase subunit C [Deltaproteobacteria bacterium]|nr:NADH-quinone oxidoreductase subunit C [Candidatus Tharpellaceae bacterium]
MDYSVYPKPKTKEAEAKLKEAKTKEEKIKEDEEKLSEAKEEEAESLKEEIQKLKEEIVKAKEEAEKLKEEAKEEEREKRFDVVYQLRATKYSHDIRIKAEVGEEDIVESATDIWGSVGCDECEVYDMFGIKFKNHPDLRRIIMPEDWVGHPYRKDYPLKGKEGDDEYLDTHLPEGQLKKPEHTRMP